MLLFTFKRYGRSASPGPVEEIEFRGSELFIGGEKASMARYTAGHWIYANERWSHAECRTRILIRFEDNDGLVGATVGPRPSLHLRERFIFLGRERVATLLPGNAHWKAVAGTESWPIVRVLGCAPCQPGGP